MKSQVTSNNGREGQTAPIQSFANFLQTLGITPVTGWRWRKSGRIQTINICGRLYVSAEAIAEFKRRAEAGEFSKEHKSPSRLGAAN